MDTLKVQELLVTNQQAMILAESSMQQLMREVEADDAATVNAAELSVAIDALYEAARAFANVRRRLLARGAA